MDYPYAVPLLLAVIAYFLFNMEKGLSEIASNLQDIVTELRKLNAKKNP